MSYKVKLLGEICEISTGSTDTKDATQDGQYPLFDRSKKIKASDKYLFDCEALIMPGEGAEFLPRHFTGKFDLHQRAYAMFNFAPQVDPRYLYFYLVSVKDHFVDVAVGATVKSLRRRHFTDLQVPLPSLEKQREIVEKLEGAFAELELLEENLDSRLKLYEDLGESFLSSIFDLKENANINPGYDFYTLGEVAKVKGGKRLPKGTKWSLIPTDFPYIRVSDIKNGRIDENSLVFVPEEIRPIIKNYTVNSGDLLISIAGTIGEIAVVPDSLDQANLTENAAKILLQRDKVNSEYCSYFLRSPVCRKEIDKLVRTTTQPKLALFRIESLRIPVPSLDEQIEIVKKLQRIFEELERINGRVKQERDDLISLRQSLLSSAFYREDEAA